MVAVGNDKKSVPVSLLNATTSDEIRSHPSSQTERIKHPLPCGLEMFDVASDRGQVVAQGGGGNQVVDAFVVGLDAQAPPQFGNQRGHAAVGQGHGQDLFGQRGGLTII
jgi:hypothetical protein